MITVEDLTLTYGAGPGAYRALRGVGFALERGQFLTLLGPSGCGKTTLLRSIAGLETPDGGRIAIGGDVVFDAASGIETTPAARNLGMVFQSYAIWPHMSVFENAAFPLRYRRREMRGSALRDRVMEALRLVRLDHLEKRPAPMLSGGQQQRLAVARALVSEPAILLLDEPLSNLDARLREDMRFELREIAQRSQVTTIFVTHEQSEALSLSDLVIVMNDGLIVEQGSPRSLYLEPTTSFVATFLGRANLVPASVTALRADGTIETMGPLGPVACRVQGSVTPGDSVQLAVRPDRVTLAAPATAPGVPVGRIEGEAFLGEVVDCAVRLGDLKLLVRVASDAVPPIGAEVAVIVDAGGCIALPMTARGAPAPARITSGRPADDE